MDTELSKIDSKVELGEAREVFELPVIHIPSEPMVAPSPELVDTPNDSRSEFQDSTVTVHALPPVDRGWKAWRFLFSGFILETFIWGFSYR